MEGSLLAHHGWLYIVAGLILAMVVALAIPYAARGGAPPMTR
ncbi:MAG TPA: hypothetical protein VF997_05100 [Polyangia bacterium]